jgi:hypothetical protein
MNKPTKTPPRDSAAPPPSKQIPALFQVLVQCRDEAEQRDVYERMTAEGRKCRLLML